MRRFSQVDSAIPQQLRLQILIRDSWRCQICGSMRRLDVHHQTFRSHGAEHSEQNLITLFRTCHSSLHGVA